MRNQQSFQTIEGDNMQVIRTRQPWDIFLLGGAAGAGKTSLSYRIARHFGVAITEVDDFQVVLECMPTPEQQPELHFWRTHPAPHTLQVEEIVSRSIAVGSVLLPALAAVILNHFESQTPVVLEGDYILPALVAHPKIAPLYQTGQVDAVFVHEADEMVLLTNFLQREPTVGPQHLRAQVSWQLWSMAATRGRTIQYSCASRSPVGDSV
jgi:2-phosphoglycerate kinase